MSRAAWSLAGRLPPALLDRTVRALPKALIRGLLEATRDLGVELRQSEAFSYELDYAPSIWLNRRGAFPYGMVSDSRAAELARDLRAELLELRDEQGRRLIAHVHLRDELPPGPFASRLPDLLILPAWPGGYRASFLPSRGPGPVVRRLAESEYSGPRGAGMPGVHKREGLLIAHGPGVPRVELPAVTLPQAGALIYPLLGLVTPPELAATLPPFLHSFATQLAPAGAQTPEPTVAPELESYSESERLTLTQRLRDLGYLE